MLVINSGKRKIVPSRKGTKTRGERKVKGFALRKEGSEAWTSRHRPIDRSAKSQRRRERLNTNLLCNLKSGSEPRCRERSGKGGETSPAAGKRGRKREKGAGHFRPECGERDRSKEGTVWKRLTIIGGSEPVDHAGGAWGYEEVWDRLSGKRGEEKVLDDGKTSFKFTGGGGGRGLNQHGWGI